MWSDDETIAYGPGSNCRATTRHGVRTVHPTGDGAIYPPPPTPQRFRYPTAMTRWPQLAARPAAARWGAPASDGESILNDKGSHDLE